MPEPATVQAGLFDRLTVLEWDALCSTLERATTAVIGHAGGLGAGVLDDLYHVHGDLMNTWQAELYAAEWSA